MLAYFFIFIVVVVPHQFAPRNEHIVHVLLFFRAIQKNVIFRVAFAYYFAYPMTDCTENVRYIRKMMVIYSMNSTRFLPFDICESSRSHRPEHTKKLAHTHTHAYTDGCFALLYFSFVALSLYSFGNREIVIPPNSICTRSDVYHFLRFSLHLI